MVVCSGVVCLCHCLMAVKFLQPLSSDRDKHNAAAYYHSQDNAVSLSSFHGWLRNTHVLCNRVRKSVQGHPRSLISESKAPANRKRLCDLLLVTNSDLGPILHRFLHTASYWPKNANFPYATLTVSEPFRFSE